MKESNGLPVALGIIVGAAIVGACLVIAMVLMAAVQGMTGVGG